MCRTQFYLAAVLLATQREAYVLVDETGTLLLHSPHRTHLRDEQPLCQVISSGVRSTPNDVNRRGIGLVSTLIPYQQ